MDPVYIEGSDVKELLEDSDYNVNSFVAPKKPLFWADESRGLYSRACNSNSNYLDSINNLNLKRLDNGEKSVANDLVKFLKDDFDLLKANAQLVKKYPELSGGWQILIDSLGEFQNTKEKKYSAIVENLEYLSDVKLDEEKAQKNLEKESLIALKASVLKNQNKVPKKILAKVPAFIRDPHVVLYVKKQANGTCDLCEKPAPFKNSHGEPYLECHHLVRLADGGADSIGNAVALCANCHRKMHILDSSDDVFILEKKIKIRDNQL